jgi:hypothetical protein
MACSGWDKKCLMTIILIAISAIPIFTKSTFHLKSVACPGSGTGISEPPGCNSRPEAKSIIYA